MALHFRIWWWEILCAVVYLALAGVQLFKTPIVGLADNGDFPKVLGRLDVCDPHEHNDYVTAEYKLGPECRWDSHLTSSEAVFVQFLKQAAAWNQKYEIGIQGEGRAHLVVVLAALSILLWALRESRPILRFGIPPLIILIFSDVAYVAWFNSFYMDAAALVFLLLTVSLACAATQRPRAWIAIAFGIAAVLFIASKSQHALLGPFVALMAAWFAYRSVKAGTGRSALLWLASTIALLVSSGAMVTRTPTEYRVYALYNMIFFNLARQSPHPAATLAEFGLDSSYLPLVGTYSFNANVPAPDPKWQAEFMARTSYSKLATYYLRHPEAALNRLHETLWVDASGIRVSYLGNYRRQDGYPPRTLANRFDAWSNLRSLLFRTFPLHVVMLYAIVGGGCIWCMFRPAMAAAWPFYPVCLVLVFCGVLEFLGSALLDCLETARHLFLFQVITEILIVCAVSAALSRFGRVRDMKVKPF